MKQITTQKPTPPPPTTLSEMQAESDERYIYNKYICNEMSIKPESIATTDQSSLDLDLAWTKLLGNSTPTNGSQVVIKLDDGKVHESPNTTSETVGVGMKKSPSWLGSFNNQIRASIKAVTESPGPITRYRQTRFSSRRVRKRVVFKHGDCNIVQGNVAKRRRRYLQDIFTTLVDVKWRWTIMVFAMSFISTWSGFACIWWLIAYAHGDLDYAQGNLINETNDYTNKTFIPCVTEIKSFATSFLFSIETQFTIGYGVRYITEECPEAIFMMCIQCITGVLIQAFMVGIVFAKLSRPKKRAQTLLFSRNAVICHRDGIPCLMFRVADMRKSHIIEAHVRAQIIRKKVTKEGEILPFYQQELKVGADGGEDRLLFVWPTTIVHKIDRQSPLYALSAQDMLKERFEIVVMLEGVVESTGMTTQARSSYLPAEILWGHRFENVVTFRKETAEYEVNYQIFNNTYEIDTPLCSAKQLDEVRAELHLPNGLERLCSAGILPRVSSAVSLDPSDESGSVESAGRLQMRSSSIPNNASFESNIYLNNNTTSTATTTTTTQNTTNTNKKKWLPTPRRLSVKAEQLPNDSIC